MQGGHIPTLHLFIGVHGLPYTDPPRRKSGVVSGAMAHPMPHPMRAKFLMLQHIWFLCQNFIDLKINWAAALKPGAACPQVHPAPDATCIKFFLVDHQQ